MSFLQQSQILSSLRACLSLGVSVSHELCDLFHGSVWVLENVNCVSEVLVVSTFL